MARGATGKPVDQASSPEVQRLLDLAAEAVERFERAVEARKLVNRDADLDAEIERLFNCMALAIQRYAEARDSVS